MLNELFANAQLTPEQKQALKSLENELSQAHIQLRQLQTKITTLEEQAGSEQAILTRPEFNREVARMLAFDERYGGQSSVLYFDIASLDSLTKRYSPAIAADTTKTITHVMMRHVRRSDIIGRLGADEFGVLRVRCNNENAWKKGRELATLLTRALETIDNVKLGLEISFGAYTFREEEDVAIGLKEAAHSLTKADKDNH